MQKEKNSEFTDSKATLDSEKGRQPTANAFDDRTAVGEGARVLLVHPFLGKAGGRRSPDEALAELVSLTEAIDLQIVDAQTSSLRSVRPSLYLGPGFVERLAAQVKLQRIELVVLNCSLSPVQQRNLERQLQAKVIDRTALILEIFGARAKTREGILQVELAHLSYQRGRLVRSWTHLERQRGGAGFLGGPGERQIEADRRVLNDKITRLRRQLETVTRTRNIHRQSRKKAPYPVVALVGYTNAGKSTLFNSLAGADVFTDDLLFATLDPTMRSIVLPSGRKIILSDTVGFISDLPTHLVAAFRATLEEVVQAEIIIHVRDIAHPESQAQYGDVMDVLKDLEISEARITRAIEVHNKIDLLDAEARAGIENNAQSKGNLVALSAIEKGGNRPLLTAIDDLLAAAERTLTIRVPFSDGEAMSWLYSHSHVINRTDQAEFAEFVVQMPARNIGRLQQYESLEILESA